MNIFVKRLWRVFLLMESKTDREHIERITRCEIRPVTGHFSSGPLEGWVGQKGPPVEHPD